MKGVNKVILVGTLGRDPETRYTGEGKAVTNVAMATSESWKDKTSGEKQERTEWHRVVFFNRLAEVAGEYLKKGSKVYVEGSLRTRKWQDQASGQDRYTTEIVASELQMLDSNPNSQQQPQQQNQRPQQQNAASQQPQQQRQQQQGQPQQQQQQQRNQPAPQQQSQQQGADAFDDEIPF